MPHYANILGSISQILWAIYPKSFDAILRGVSGSLSAADYELFHRLDAEVKSSTLDFLGPRVPNSRYSRVSADGTGSIFVDGPIIPRATGFSDISGVTSIDVLTKEFLSMEANPAVKKVLLAMDTPGGSVTGLSEFVEVLNARSKPLEALNIGLMASAGYWIASAADKIYSVDTGLSGSIGTIMTLPNADDTTTVIQSDQSPNKTMDVTTKSGLAEAKRIVNDLAAIFISGVAANRGVSEKVVMSQYGKGSVFVAEDAMIRGMIDGITSLRDYMSGSPIKTKAQPLEVESASSIAVSSKSDINKTKTIKKESRMETLAELLAKNSGASAEMEAIKGASCGAGVAATIAKNKQVTPYLNSAAYGGPVRALACKVLDGEADLSALQSAVTVIDATREAGLIEAAVGDVAYLPETPTQAPEAKSVDGEINSESDFEASLAAQKAQLI